MGTFLEERLEALERLQQARKRTRIAAVAAIAAFVAGGITQQFGFMMIGIAGLAVVAASRWQANRLASDLAPVGKPTPEPAAADPIAPAHAEPEPAAEPSTGRPGRSGKKPSPPRRLG